MTQETDTSVSAALRERVLSTPDRYWSLDELGDTSPAELRELSRIVKAGKLVRVRRGLYWRGTPTPFGMSPPPEVLAVRAIVGVFGSGPAGASAAAELGLSSQVPATMVVATPRRTAVPRGLSVQFVSRPARVGRESAKLRPAEVALLEVLESWESTVELAALEAVARIRNLVNVGAIDVDRVVRASPSEPASVRARLRALLTALGEVDLAGSVPRPRTPRLRDEARILFAEVA